MTTGKFTLVIRWPSGQSTICGEMTDHQHGEICRILSPDYRAQLPSQGGEAVEVVATVEAYGVKWAGIHWGECIGSTEDPERQLMTVAQHNRIVAAATHPADQVADGVAELKALLPALDDALEDLDAFRSHIHTDNAETLANALKEIERLKTISDNYCALLMDANQKLQSAPAERGAPDETAMARALCNYHADLCGVNRDDQWNLFSEDFLNDVAVMLAADRRLNPAPATADSDVRGQVDPLEWSKKHGIEEY